MDRVPPQLLPDRQPRAIRHHPVQLPAAGVVLRADHSRRAAAVDRVRATVDSRYRSIHQASRGAFTRHALAARVGGPSSTAFQRLGRQTTALRVANPPAGGAPSCRLARRASCIRRQAGGRASSAHRVRDRGGRRRDRCRDCSPDGAGGGPRSGRSSPSHRRRHDVDRGGARRSCSDMEGLVDSRCGRPGRTRPDAGATVRSVLDPGD